MPADDTTPLELPMFPLGSVLLPGMVLPLRVFEPRYRVLVDTVLLSDAPEFGCVLIERGSEVGGGDVRTSVGCLARIVQLARHPDGQVSLVAVGAHRLRVLEWLPDDPFPRAVVQHWPDEPGPEADSAGAAAATGELDRLELDVRDLARLASEMGVGEGLEDEQFSDDPGLRSFQLATVSPLGALDRLNVLRAPTLAARVALLADLVAEQRIMLEARRDFGRG